MLTAGLLVGAAVGASGQLDPSFGGGDGVATAAVAVGEGYDANNAVVLQPDGKIVAAGGVSPLAGGGRWDFAAVRFDASGTLDPTFGGDGIVTTPIGPGTNTDYAWSAALQPDGKIILAGQANMGAGAGGVNFALVRYNRDGTLDVSFGGGTGIVTTAVAPGDRSDFAFTHALLVLPDGKIVAGGAAGMGPGGGGRNFALVRYNSDGTLDPTFGAYGIVTTALAPGDNQDYVSGLALQPDGRIVAAGVASADDTGAEPAFDHALARYNPDGTLDLSFGTNGKVITAVAEGLNRDAPWGGVKIQPNGKIVTAGVVLVGPNNANREFALVRYNRNGELDHSFGEDGIVRMGLAPGSEDDVFWAMALYDDGKIVAAGVTGGADTVSGDFVVALFNPNGKPHKSFGQGGFTVNALGTNPYDAAYAVAIQPNGRIVATGECDLGSPSGIDICAARYLGLEGR